MRTTLKRGVGRGAAFGGGEAIASAPPLAPVAIYRQPPPIAEAGGRSLLVRTLGWAALVLAVVVSGVAGGAYLYVHESVAAVAPRTLDVKKAAKRLDVVLPGQPTTAARTRRRAPRRAPTR